MTATHTISLHRRLTLPLLVLYGVGITVGAGIYVLIGAMAAHAGMHAPLAFVVGGLVMGFTAASYAELCTRYPYSAGEAAYVRAAFRSRLLSRITGLATIAIGVVSSAAVSIGSVGYIRELTALPDWILLLLVVTALGAVACWGILESVLLAALFTLIEIAGLLLVIAAGATSDIEIAAAVPQMLFPPADMTVFTGIAFASLLAFFAFIGFEDLVNVAEEAREPERTLPRAIAITLGISICLYCAVAIVSVAAVDPAVLGASPAPLSLVFRQVSGFGTVAITLIAIIATLNTILAQMTMASRVLYGMAGQGDLPAIFGSVYRRTRTPVFSTVFVSLLVIALALAFSLERLAEATSLATLAVFAVVNLALLKLKRDQVTPAADVLTLPTWIPLTGFLTCLSLLATALL